jgi:hypothetical protein
LARKALIGDRSQGLRYMEPAVPCLAILSPALRRPSPRGRRSSTGEAQGCRRWLHAQV